MKSKKLNNLIKDGTFKDQQMLGKYSYSNLFDVVNKGQKSFFNLCKNIYINNINDVGLQYVEIYTITEDDNWANISYKFYNTYQLWWLICKFNGINNPFTELIPGNKLRIPTKQLVDTILEIIQSS